MTTRNPMAQTAVSAAQLVDALRGATSNPQKFLREGHHGRSY